jgi:hypothetical protein
MAIPLVTATFTGVDTRLKFKNNELLQIRVYSDTQFPIVVEFKDNPRRYPYTSIENFLSSWKNISKVAEMGR